MRELTLVTVALLGFIGSALAQRQYVSKTDARKPCTAYITQRYASSTVDKYDASKNSTIHVGEIYDFSRTTGALFGGHDTFVISFAIVDSTGRLRNQKALYCILNELGNVLGVEPIN
jgi:hypothetical protein